jgi:pimeloyl-ACP methyl ester carboxylesterase
MKYLTAIVLLLLYFTQNAQAELIYDADRDRQIPLELIFPPGQQCSPETKCAVALLSAGYGVSHLQYGFIAEVFAQHGYLVVAIGHELPTDPPLAVSGNLYEARSENWRRGAQTLDVVVKTLGNTLAGYDFNHITLIGHSNGGDISAWLANQGKTYISGVITLDHRRVPLPRDNKLQILSIRASDFPADNGVLPSAAEQQQYGSCVVTIAQARHNDMTDDGPGWLKDKIQQLLQQHLAGQPCKAA